MVLGEGKGWEESKVCGGIACGAEGLKEPECEKKKKNEMK